MSRRGVPALGKSTSDAKGRTWIEVRLTGREIEGDACEIEGDVGGLQRGAHHHEAIARGEVVGRELVGLGDGVGDEHAASRAFELGVNEGAQLALVVESRVDAGVGRAEVEGGEGVRAESDDGHAE